MEQIPSREADTHSANKKILPFIELGLSSRSQDHATGPYPEADVSNPYLPNLFL
jgi:hypothetical protein